MEELYSIVELKNCLESLISKTNNITIVPHTNVDFDAIGSAIALAIFTKKYKKNTSIIVNEHIYEIQHGIQTIIDEARDKGINIVSKDIYLKRALSNDLIVLTDVNKKGLIPFKEIELNNKKTVIIDHHQTDQNTVSSDYSYINTNISSACEIMANLLNTCKIKYDEDIANYLLAGIYLDTNRFTKNTNANTMATITKLMKSQASMEKISKLFETDFEVDKKVFQLIERTNFSTYTMAVAIGSEKLSYTREELAKTADKLLDYNQADCTFALGKNTDGNVLISARSKNGDPDVGKIMHVFEGGGNCYSAAAKIDNESLEETGKKLQKLITPNFYHL